MQAQMLAIGPRQNYFLSIYNDKTGFSWVLFKDLASQQ